MYLVHKESNNPEESQGNIFNYDKVIHPCTRVQKFFPQPLVSPIGRCKEAKVHLEIPESAIEGRDSLANQPGIEPQPFLCGFIEKTEKNNNKSK